LGGRFVVELWVVKMLDAQPHKKATQAPNYGPQQPAPHRAARVLHAAAPRHQVHRLLRRDELPDAVRGQHHELVVGGEGDVVVVGLGGDADL
jgi:hypothetical protein